MLCTLWLHLHLLTMASKPSKTTPTSTTAKPDPISQPHNTVPGKKNSDATPTLSTPKPAPTSVVQQYVTDAAEMISLSPTSRRIFLTGVTKKCLEVAKQEKEAGRPFPEPSRKLTTPLMKQPQNTTPPEENLGDTPHTSTSPSGSTYTITVSSNPGETTTTTTTANTAEGSTPHAEWKKTTSVVSENYNTSGRIMRKRVEQGLPNQAITLFVPVGMAEDLTKVQLILQ